MANEVLRIQDLNFASRDSGQTPIMEKSLLFGSFGFVSVPYGDYWRFMKKLLVKKLLGSHSLEQTRLLRWKELQTFRAMLFDKATKNETVDVGKEMMKLTNNSICRMTMGRSCSEENDEAEQVRGLVTKSLSLTKKFLIASIVGHFSKLVGISLFGKEIKEHSQRFDELLEKIIKEHEKDPNNGEDRDMMDVLLEVCADDNAEFKISRNQIKALFVETPSNVALDTGTYGPRNDTEELPVREQKVTGNAETPFLLALVKHNALISSKIATTMAAISVDFQLCFIFILLAIFSLFCFSAFFFKKPKDPQLQGCGLPPSPPSLPIIGHLHFLLSVPCYKSFQKLSSKYGPFLHLRAFNIPIVLVSSGSMANEVLRIQDLNFASRDSGQTPIMEKSLLFGSFGFVSVPYGDYWRFMKKLLVKKLLGSHSLEQTRLLRGKELQTFRAMLFDKAAKNETVDVGKEMMKLTNNSICRMTMGRSCSEENGEAEQVRGLVTKSLSLTKKFLIASIVGQFSKLVGISLFGKEIMEVSQRYDELLEKIIKEHEENPNNGEDRDMMDVLLEVCADDNAEFKISRNQIKALFVEIFLAGTDTSAQTIQWILAELINHPEILEKLRKEIESVVGVRRLIQETDLPNLPYLQAVMKEGLRLHPHTPILVRNATEGCKIGGYYIGQNTTMMVNAYAVLRDPDSWEYPEEFQPERFMTSPLKGKEDEKAQLALNFIPFGSGRRGCLGKNLGYIFMGVAIGTMVQGFDWRINGDKVNMEETGEMTLTMAHPLKCIPVARINPASFDP
ncbi:Cytochrome P450 [Arabidopsis suecica]|nr:Cytochrome P450 [Arabidopsis suecica]